MSICTDFADIGKRLKKLELDPLINPEKIVPHPSTVDGPKMIKGNSPYYFKYSAPPIISPLSHHDFAVYFDYGSSSLDASQAYVFTCMTPQFIQTINHIDLYGHADTKEEQDGTDITKSVCRVDSVLRELVKFGFNASIITEVGLGATQLLTQTGPGIRERANRRVEVKFS